MLDLLKVLSVEVTARYASRKQLMHIQQGLSDGEKIREQHADAIEKIEDLRKENKEKSETLATLHSQLSELLSVDSAHIK